MPGQWPAGDHLPALPAGICSACRPQMRASVREGQHPSQAIGDSCHSIASQGLNLLVAAGDVNDYESVADSPIVLRLALQR